VLADSYEYDLIVEERHIHSVIDQTPKPFGDVEAILDHQLAEIMGEINLSLHENSI
jgi:hypothetical protein